MGVFTKALYYPTIDIPDEWLKNTILLCDEISTIVPKHLYRPFHQSETVDYLLANDMLKKYEVSTDHPAVKEQEQLVKNLLNSPEMRALLKPNLKVSADSFDFIYNDKLPMTRVVSRLWEKYQDGIMDKIGGIVYLDGYDEDLDKGIVPKSFLNVYMTSLAECISEVENYGLLTNLVDNQNLANDLKIGKYNLQNSRVDNIAHGYIMEYSIKSINFDTNVSIKDILKFKKEHVDLIDNLRMAFESLNTADARSFEELQRLAKENYQKNILTSMNKLEKSLKDNQIKYFTHGFWRIVELSMTALAASEVSKIPPIITVPFAIGSALTTIKSEYDASKEKKLSSNPYSYLYLLNQSYG